MSIEPNGRRYRDAHGITRWEGPRPVDEPFDRASNCDDCRREMVVRSKWRQLAPEERLPTQACRSTLRLCVACDARRKYRAKRDAKLNLQIGA